jgi:Holliday junction resolvasome RuvABC endonuclease subunit
LPSYFTFRPHEVLQHTQRQTTQLANYIINHPMQQLKSRFQMLWQKINEVIDTDTYFASEKYIEGYYCEPVFFGMNSKTLYVVGMKTES